MMAETTDLQHLLPSYLPVSRLTAGNNGCMGVGIPFGIAAKLALPTRMVIAICGDFAFGLSAMEMETAVRLRVPVIIVVANNDGNGGTANQKISTRKIIPTASPCSRRTFITIR